MLENVIKKLCGNFRTKGILYFLIRSTRAQNITNSGGSDIYTMCARVYFCATV